MTLSTPADLDRDAGQARRAEQRQRGQGDLGQPDPASTQPERAARRLGEAALREDLALEQAARERGRAVGAVPVDEAAAKQDAVMVGGRPQARAEQSAQRAPPAAPARPETAGRRRPARGRPPASAAAAAGSPVAPPGSASACSMRSPSGPSPACGAGQPRSPSRAASGTASVQAAKPRQGLRAGQHEVDGNAKAGAALQGPEQLVQLLAPRCQLGGGQLRRAGRSAAAIATTIPSSGRSGRSIASERRNERHCERQSGRSSRSSGRSSSSPSRQVRTDRSASRGVLGHRRPRPASARPGGERADAAARDSRPSSTQGTS